MEKYLFNKKNRKELFIELRVLILAAVIFAFDILTPLGYAVWLFYVVPLLLLLPSTRKGISYFLSALLTLFIVAEVILSPRLPIPFSVIAINEGTAIVIFWLTAVLLEKYKNAIGFRKLTEQLTLSNAKLQEEIHQREIIEKECLKQEKEFRTLAENSPDPIVRIDASLNILYANVPAAKMLGLQKLTKDMSIHALPIELENEENMGNRIRGVFASANEFIGEVHLPLPSGDKYLTVRYVPELDEEGAIVSVLGIYHDVTASRIAEKRMLEAKELAETRAREAEEGRKILEALMEQIPEGVTIADAPDGNIRMVSSYGKELLGRKQETIEGISIKKYIAEWELFRTDGSIPQPEETPLFRAVKKGEAVRNEEWLLRRADGTAVITLINAGPIRDKSGSIIGGVTAWRDITERKKTEERIRYISYHDKITDLYNWTFFNEEVKRLDTERELPISIIMLDVNNLKLTNDVFGHQEGDRLLKILADSMKQSCRDEDIVARWGGDEFVIFLSKTSCASAEIVGNRIKKTCFEAQGLPLRCSISVGVSCKERKEYDINDIIKQSEERMYKNKVLESSESRKAIIASMLSKLENIETRRHLDRLKTLAEDAGEILGLSRKQVGDLILFATLHDVGKTAMPERLLEQPHSLSPEEWVEMKKHTEIGARIAHAVPELARVEEAILLHHERWDGKGYPKGLKDDQIPLLVRILAVLDAYDAMTHERPYKKALTHEEALEELRKGAGTQFDPELVALFVSKVFAKIHA